jgi:hypothetical protein
VPMMTISAERVITPPSLPVRRIGLSAFQYAGSDDTIAINAGE